MPLNDRQWRGLAQDLRRAGTRVRPDWTDSGAHDPAVTVLELLAFALEDLQLRAAATAPMDRSLLRSVAQRIGALTAALDHAAASDCERGLQRVHYFAGMLLGIEDFRAEQDYFRSRLKRRNLVLGSGILAGLDISIGGSAAAPQVVIAPGLAVDPKGEEICVDTPYALALPTQGTSLLALINYLERPCRNHVVVPTHPADGPANPAPQSTRIVETFAATLAPGPSPDALAIGRLRLARGRWRVDASFEPLRLTSR